MIHTERDMKMSGRFIAKILVLCGISLTCTACYAAPRANYRPPQEDFVSEEIAGGVAAEAGSETDISPEELKHEKPYESVE